jgi:hypothetical protein
MVIGVLIACLGDVVVYVSHTNVVLNPRHAELLKLHPHHCPRRILHKRLIDVNSNLRPRLHLAIGQVHTGDSVS